MNKLTITMLTLAALIIAACGGTQKQEESTETESAPTGFSGAKGEVKLMTLDPGHFHAALVQKSMYDQVSPKVFVYAPEGDDVKGHLKRIENYNTRAENPTSWEEVVYTGPDFFEKMLSEQKGNVMMVSGNNSKKTSYIKKAADQGINIFADKPMAINSTDFTMLEEAFKSAEANGVLLYDIMTERHEITTMLQKELSQMPEVFGKLQDGTAEEPAITKESVHHFFKYVSGNPLIRPAWFFDTEQQGEGIVDVNTHLVDLIQWEAFPEVILAKSDVEIISARRWPTIMTPEQFKKVTGLDEFPEYLQKDIVDGNLHTYANGEIIYKLKGKVAKASAIWNYVAPEGTGDTHYSIMRGTLCDIIIRQGKEENYKPTVYIESSGADMEAKLKKALEETLSSKYPGLKLVSLSDGQWSIDIPAKYSVGHEAHFAQVTEKYLKYLVDGKLPGWEVPNMIVKYYTTTQGLEKAMEE